MDISRGHKPSRARLSLFLLARENLLIRLMSLEFPRRVAWACDRRVVRWKRPSLTDRNDCPNALKRLSTQGMVRSAHPSRAQTPVNP